MNRGVKPKRAAYNSPRRQEQAAATRTAILDAARTAAFETDGYANTSMDAIASRSWGRVEDGVPRVHDEERRAPGAVGSRTQG